MYSKFYINSVEAMREDIARLLRDLSAGRARRVCTRPVRDGWDWEVEA